MVSMSVHTVAVCSKMTRSPTPVAHAHWMPYTSRSARLISAPLNSWTCRSKRGSVRSISSAQFGGAELQLPIVSINKCRILLGFENNFFSVEKRVPIPLSSWYPLMLPMSRRGIRKLLEVLGKQAQCRAKLVVVVEIFRNPATGTCSLPRSELQRAKKNYKEYNWFLKTPCSLKS